MALVIEMLVNGLDGLNGWLPYSRFLSIFQSSLRHVKNHWPCYNNINKISSIRTKMELFPVGIYLKRTCRKILIKKMRHRISCQLQWKTCDQGYVQDEAYCHRFCDFWALKQHIEEFFPQPMRPQIFGLQYISYNFNIRAKSLQQTKKILISWGKTTNSVFFLV